MDIFYNGSGAVNPALRIKTNGQAYVAGNLGVGVTSPTNKLEVNGSAAFSGSVGIGTTAPSTKLVVSNSGAQGIEFNPTGGGPGGGEAYLQVYNRSASAYGRMAYIGDSHDFHTSGHGYNAMTIANNGAVGIGTASPYGLLEIQHSCCNRDGIVIAPDANMDNNISISTYIDAGLGGSYPNRGGYAGGCCNNLALQPDAGTVSVGGVSSNYGYKFNVTGTAKADSFYTPTTDSWLGNPNGWNYIRGNTYGWYNVAWYDENNGAYRLDPSGYTNFQDFHWATGGQNSDIRLKKDITPLHDSLLKILQLRGVNYYFRSDSKFGEMAKDKQLGVIAQEVEPIVPEVISKDSDGYESVDYGKLSALLIEGMKEQQKQLEAEKTKNEEQETVIKSLQEQLISLQKRIEELEQR